MKLPEVIITERDAQMWELKRGGASPRQIGKALNVSESTVYKGLKRIENKIIQQLASGYQQEWLLDLQRMDGILMSFIPATKPTKMVTDDGEEITIPPSPDAANIVLKTIAQRSKHLGFDQNSNMEIGGGGPASTAPALGPAAEDEKEKTPESEARELLKVMQEAGVFDESIFAKVRDAANIDDVVDAEIVEDDDTEKRPALDPIDPPEFFDGYDEEAPSDIWHPEDD